jgi:hypothetical protein
MQIEYFKVTFDPDDVRAVLLDDVEIGRTETVLQAEADDYTISLSGDGYAPRYCDVTIAGTTAENPLIVAFRKVAVTP